MPHVQLVPAIVGCVSLCSLTIGGFPLSPPAPRPPNPSRANDNIYTGIVAEWWVAAPGRVQFLVVGAGREGKDGKEAKHPDLWFDTPADKDVNTLYEALVLDVVMHAATKGLPLLVEAKNSSGDDGTTAAKAFDVLRVGIGKN